MSSIKQTEIVANNVVVLQFECFRQLLYGVAAVERVVLVKFLCTQTIRLRFSEQINARHPVSCVIPGGEVIESILYQTLYDKSA